MDNREIDADDIYTEPANRIEGRDSGECSACVPNPYADDFSQPSWISCHELFGRKTFARLRIVASPEDLEESYDFEFCEEHTKIWAVRFRADFDMLVAKGIYGGFNAEGYGAEFKIIV